MKEKDDDGDQSPLKTEEEDDKGSGKVKSHGANIVQIR